MMLNRLKALGLALFAALAIGAVTASAASAVPQFHAESADTTLTGASATPSEWAFDVGTVKCEVKFDGTTQSKTSTAVTIRPTFEKCKFGAENAQFTANGCDFPFHVGANEEDFTGTMDIECPDTVIEIDIPFCTITIPEQTGLGSVRYTNEGAGTTRAVIFDIALSGIEYTEHGFFCANETVVTNNGGFVSQVTVKGENAGGEHRGFWVE